MSDALALACEVARTAIVLAEQAGANVRSTVSLYKIIQRLEYAESHSPLAGRSRK